MRGLTRAAGVDDLQPVVFPGGAAALAPGSLWVLAGERGHRSLGPAIALALRRRSAALDLVVDDATAGGVAARRAEAFVLPVRVWVTVQGKALAQAAPAPRSVFVQPERTPLWDEIEAAGAEVIVEHGVVRAEVRGLEIARIERDEDGGELLAVGVGKHDREAHRMADPHAAAPALLARLVRQVRAGRQAGVTSGPASDLARERWLRWIALRRPEIVGARRLVPVDPPEARPDLRALSIAPAIGPRLASTGAAVTAVHAFSVGVDPGLVPAAGDVDSRLPLVLVVPEGDDANLTRELAAARRDPATIVTVPASWPAMGD